MTRDERQAEIQRIRTEYAGILATPLVSEGAMGPAQIHRMSKNQYDKWRRNAQERMKLESRIRELNQSDEEIAKVNQWYADRERQGRILQLTRRIEDLSRIGIGKSGKIRPTYQKEIDICKAELTKISIDKKPRNLLEY